MAQLQRVNSSEITWKANPLILENEDEANLLILWDEAN